MSVADAAATTHAQVSAPRHAVRAVVVAATIYVAASLALFHPLLTDLARRAPQAGSGDVAQMAWFQSWTAWAITHGHDPLISHAMNVPHGVNLMWNTAMPLAGALMTPVTLAFGPLTTVNLLFIAGPITTALTARWWLSRHVRTELARVVGGFVVGFGPFVAAHLGGHLNFTVLPLVPVILRLGEDVLWRSPGARKPAILLGVAVAAQALLSEEVLLIVFIGGVVLLVAGLACLPSLRHRPRRDVIRGCVVSLVTATAIFAWPLTVQLFGPDRARGVNTARYFAQPRDFVIPSDHEFFGSAAQTQELISRGSNAFEDAVYLGVPALALFAVALVYHRRSRLAWTAVLAGLLVALLALGSGVHGAFWTGVAHPFAPLLAPPVLSSIVPQRFGLLLTLLAAFALAKVTDDAAARVRWRVPSRATAVLAGVAIVLVSWAPAPPSNQVDARVPSFFNSEVRQALPAASRVILLPAPTQADDSAVLYQAVARMRFAMLGSYAISLDDSGRMASHATPDPLTAVSTQSPAQVQRSAPSIRHAVAAAGVTAVILVPGALTARVLPAVEAVYGTPDQRDGVDLWRVTPAP
ncbi:MAG TPA: hypothetical protein VF218_15730 [Acidothermaceae bacterium]